MRKEPGRPSVAGKNALREQSVYTDWSHVHAGTPGYKPPNPTISPRLRKQIQDLHLKHRPQEGQEGELTAGGAGGFIGPIKIEDPSDNMPSPPPPKNIKLEARSPSPEPDPQRALDEVIAENQVMRGVIPDLSQAVAVLMKDRGALMNKQARAHEDLLKQIMTLPRDDQERFERPLAESSKVMNKTASTDKQVTELVDNVRAKLIEMGLGSLLVAMDREFCIPIAESPEE
ncbi:MAG: hypothetical protein Q9225_005785 [Loekoesia sp. 1 TL-2023]